MLALLLKVREIGESYERRQGNNWNADFIARYMAGFLVRLNLPADLRSLADGFRGDAPSSESGEEES